MLFALNCAFLEILSFAVTRVDVEMIILSENRERQIPRDVTCTSNLKYDSGGEFPLCLSS